MSVNTKSENGCSSQTILNRLNNTIPTLLAAAGKAAMVPVTQPIQTAMREQQASVREAGQRPLNFVEASKKIIQNDGTKGLWKGTTPSVAKEFIKYGTYKVWVIQNLPQWVDETIPSASNMQKAVAAGALAAATDVAIGGPFERYSTYLQTAPADGATKMFLQDLSKNEGLHNKWNFLNKGAGAAFVKGSAQFGLMFGLKEPVKGWVNTIYNLDDSTQNAPWYATFTSALLSGVIVAGFTAPVDIVKTIKQMPGDQNASLLHSLEKNVRTHGIKGLTTGILTKSGMIAAGWSANFLISELPTMWKKSSDEQTKSSQHSTENRLTRR